MLERRSHSWPAVAALLFLLALAGLLRFWGIDYGLPHLTTRPDEERIVGRAFAILSTGHFHPGDFTYPGLLKYLSALALALYYGVGKLIGHYQEFFDFQFEAVVSQPGLLYRICRSVSALLGVGSVGTTYLLARQAYRSRSIGLVAAATLATCYLHVRDSHFATVDVAMTFFVILSLLFAVKVTVRYRTRHFALAGLFAGLAAATKYNAGVVILGILAACLPVLPGIKRREDLPSPTKILGRLALAGVLMAVAFALTSPYSLLHYPALLKELQAIRNVLYEREGPMALWVHLNVTFPGGFGWPFFLASLAGVIRAAWLHRPADLVLLAFLIPFFGSAAGVGWVFPRYLVPLTPLFATLAAEFSCSMLRKACIPVLSQRPYAAALLAALVLAGPGLWRSIQFDRLASRKDTRLLASEWVAENLPRRSVILLCRGYGAPRINADRRRPPAFEPKKVRCTGNPVPALSALSGAGARYLITHQHPQLKAFSSIPDGFERWLVEHARPLAVFDPFVRGSGRETSRPYFYTGDGFYLPLTGLGAMERGGPILTIWDLKGSG
jgi:hypothetical protein